MNTALSLFGFVTGSSQTAGQMQLEKTGFVYKIPKRIKLWS